MNRLGRFDKSPGVTADYLAIERARADRMEKRADELLAALREALTLIHPKDMEFAPKTRAILAKIKA